MDENVNLSHEVASAEECFPRRQKKNAPVVRKVDVEKTFLPTKFS